MKHIMNTFPNSNSDITRKVDLDKRLLNGCQLHGPSTSQHNIFIAVENVHGVA